MMKRFLLAVLTALLFPLASSGESFFEKGNLSQDQLILYAELFPAKAKPGDEIRLRLWGRLTEMYHIYSVEAQGEFAPPPTKLIVFSRLLTSRSPLKESAPQVVEDKAFGMSLKVHKNDFWIERTYKINGDQTEGDLVINGLLVYQVCDNLICSLPLEKAFKVSLTVDH